MIELENKSEIGMALFKFKLLIGYTLFRYINILDPNINHESWKKEEDQILVEYYHKVGPYWSEISKYLKGRPENMVKNRFYSYI